ncbi:MAG: hypothetical protein WBO34_03185 [Gammaproteobacteria bacterium]
METHAISDGWQRLSNGFDVEFKHNIPYRVSDNGQDLDMSDSLLLEEIKALGKLPVQLGEWQPGERPDEHEARLYISDRDFARVLERLACSAAVVFVDRYHKTVDENDTDWDRLEYLKDFHNALDCCGLAVGDIEPDDFRDAYIDVMHRETRRLAQTSAAPPVEPEQDT